MPSLTHTFRYYRRALHQRFTVARMPKGSRLIVTAGMPRSGSTWQYNAARLLLQRTGLDVGGGWIEDFPSFCRHQAVIVKAHDFEPVIARQAYVVLSSYRDLRDALASHQRAFRHPTTMQFARRIAGQSRAWEERADFVMRYEDMILEPSRVLAGIAKALGISGVELDAVVKELDALRFEKDRKGRWGHDAETLLHATHFTNGRHGSWEGELSPAFVEQLEQELGDWLESHGYELTQRKQPGSG